MDGPGAAGVRLLPPSGEGAARAVTGARCGNTKSLAPAMPSRLTVATQLTSAGSRMPVLSRLNWKRLPSAKALIVVDALNCLIRSDVSGMSTLTIWMEMTRPSTLTGGRPSKVRTIGNWSRV